MPYKPKKQRKKVSAVTSSEANSNLSSFNFGVISSTNIKEKDDTPLILHLQIPITEESSSQLNEPNFNNIKHRENSLTEPLAYTPNLDIPHPYESHSSDSIPFTLETDYENTESNNNTRRPCNIEKNITNISTSLCSVVTPRTYDDSCCWWCCHPYKTNTVALPINKTCDDNKYTTIGTFCSPECAAAYNFESGHRYGDIWKQYTMLHNVVFASSEKTYRIKLAPPRESLSMFGGPYTILKYREFIKQPNIQIKMTVNPINPIFTITEESIPSNVYPSKNNNSDVPLDSKRIQKASTELRLKRMKRQTKENTLENFMQLKIGV